MKILVLGGNGIAGHIIASYLKDRGNEVITVSRKQISFANNIVAEITDFEMIKKIVLDGDYDAVIDAVGILTHEAEKNKSQAILLNSYLPHFLSEITKDTKTKIINLGTNCVFSGSKGAYVEADIRDGLTFYDRSKGLGELENNKDLTFRTSFIGPDLDNDGIGLFNWFMQQTGTIKGFTNVYWSGVTTIVLARAIQQALESNLSGLYHLVNNQRISKFELVQLFQENMNKRDLKILPIESKFEDKSLYCSRNDFDFEVPNYDGMIKEMTEWIKTNKELYPHYFKGEIHE